MRKTILKHITVLLGYCFLATVLTWPVIVNIGTDIAGAGGDPWQTLWRLEETEGMASQAISEGRLLELLAHEIGGQGEARLVNLSAWPWLWLMPLVGTIASYNIIWLSSFVLAGYGMYLLIDWIVNRNIRPIDSAGKAAAQPILSLTSAVCFVTGMAYMLLPYHAAHARGHFGAMQIQWLPLIILTAWSLIDKPKPWKGIVLVMLMTMQAWTEHHYFLWLVVFGVWFIIYHFKEVQVFLRTKNGGWYVAVIGVILVATVGLALGPTLRLAGDGDQLSLGKDQIVRYSADPFSYIVPASFHPIWGSAANRIWGTYFTGNVEEATLFVGFLPLLLVGFFWQRVPARQLHFWLTTAGIFLVISFGPKLHVLGYITDVSLPWDLVDEWPVLSAVRTMSRAGVLVGLSWIVLFGWVLNTQIKRFAPLVVVVIIIVIEFLFLPVAMMPARIPKIYEVISEQPGRAIIEIPTATNYTVASRALYGSLRHEKTVLNNIALERAEGAEAYSDVRSLPALRQLMYLRTSHLLERRNEFMGQDMKETWLDVVRLLDVRQVVIHPDSLSEIQKIAVVDFLEEVSGLEREIVDDAWLYRLSDNEIGDGIFVARDDGWGEVGKDPATGNIIAGIKKMGTLTVYNSNNQPTKVRISWQRDYETKDNLTVRANNLIDINWSDDNEVESINLMVKPGKNMVEITNSGEKAVILTEPLLHVDGL